MLFCVRKSRIDPDFGIFNKNLQNNAGQTLALFSVLWYNDGIINIKDLYIMKKIINQTYDHERALYASDGVECENCTFAGPADGESAFKESKNLVVRKCNFELRYPFWHDDHAEISDSVFTSTCRAPFWYSHDITLRGCSMESVKAFRECEDVVLEDCNITSSEFGWRCRNVRMHGGSLTSEYFMFGTDGICMDGVHFGGKYSFQYVKNVEIRNCVLDTKDAFWHAENVTVYDSVVKGEYLGWYSKNLRLVRCEISGTQPLCYAENLVLEDCTMDGCDLSFEYASVHADVRGEIMSVKNPASGSITADRIGEIILDEYRRETECTITERSKQA